jgi:hypothetical protein
MSCLTSLRARITSRAICLCLRSRRCSIGSTSNPPRRRRARATGPAGRDRARASTLAAASRGGSLTAAVATKMLTVFVAGVAIVFLHHRATPAPNSVPPGSLASDSGHGRDARSQLAILRRPQGTAERLAPWAVAAEKRPDCSNCLNLAKVDTRDARLLTMLQVRAPGGRGELNERIYMIVGMPTAAPRGTARLSMAGGRRSGCAERST